MLQSLSSSLSSEVSFNGKTQVLATGIEINISNMAGVTRMPASPFESYFV